MPRAARPRSTIVTHALAIAIGVSACGADGATDPASPQLSTRLLVENAAFPVALVAETDGGLLYGERLTGAVRRVDGSGALDPEPVTTVPVVAAESDQRGLLGLARDQRGRLFAAWTRAGDGRLVVGELGDGAPRIVWEGPVSADLANGGHLATLPDGRLLTGVGDLLEPGELADDPSVPNRKMLVLDPDGAATQPPTILSTGWNNPFAFTVAPDGVVWVADNTGGAGPERIGRGDRPASEATAMTGPGDDEVVPAALAPLSSEELALCTYKTADLRIVDIRDGQAVAPSSVLAEPCGTGVVQLSDGRLALASADRIVVTAR